MLDAQPGNDALDPAEVLTDGGGGAGRIACPQRGHDQPMLVQRDLPLLILAGVLLQMFVTTGARFVRTEAAVMIALFALFLAAQFMGFGLALP